MEEEQALRSEYKQNSAEQGDLTGLKVIVRGDNKHPPLLN